jgi:hypothetical protein
MFLSKPRIRYNTDLNLCFAPQKNMDVLGTGVLNLCFQRTVNSGCFKTLRESLVFMRDPPVLSWLVGWFLR